MIERGQITLLYKEGFSISAISKKIKCSRCAVRVTLKRFEETGKYTNRPKSGRKRHTTIREDRVLVHAALRNRRKSSKELRSDMYEQHNINISAQTVRRRLTEAGLYGRKARRKPLLSEKHKEKRLVWAKKYAKWTIDDWTKIIWSDETNIEVIYNFICLVMEKQIFTLFFFCVG